MDRTIGSSLISISFLSGGKQIRLTSPADWERAVRVGEISPTSLVVIEYGAITEAVDASDIEDLAAYFRAPRLTLTEAMDSALVAPSTSAGQPVWAAAPALRTA